MQPLKLTHPTLQAFLADPATTIDPRPYMAEGGGGTQALIRAYLVKAWEHGYRTGKEEMQGKVARALSKLS